ncbi:F-box/WD repeat-containing protein 12 [Oryzias melastigma]|uniref:F-box/WD repeat-containing protein 12 n=1 Tax=Oryzias melastigma TaxID=30732 RepID=A0A834CJW9_ORYME|nr:F-box/WD repeat-containing protein 12 [Oryzias melastigma]
MTQQRLPGYGVKFVVWIILFLVRMCLQRWSFCNLAALGSQQDTYSWKRYFLRRSVLEANMTKGRTGSYKCKSLRGHTGSVVGLVYLHGNSSQNPKLWNTGATVCSASSDCTLRAWNVQNGEQLWCTPVQNPLTGIICEEQHQVVITSDSTGRIQTWQGQTGQELGSYSTSSPHCTLLQYNKNDDWFLTVGTSLGSLQTLAGFTLTSTSRVVVCDSFRVNLLLVSPDKKWVVAGTKGNGDLFPKVISSESLTSPSEDEGPLCQSLPVTECKGAVFVPGLPARLVVIHHSADLTHNNILTVFDISIKKMKYSLEIIVQQVESFSLTHVPFYPEILLEAKSSNCIVLAADKQLWVYSLKGALLTSFSDHIEPISSICVDSFRVVTASQDLSLRVLTWRNSIEHGVTLESQFHLLGGSHTMSRGFSHVACDYSSIVASVQGIDYEDVLKAYSFTS